MTQRSRLLRAAAAALALAACSPEEDDPRYDLSATATAASVRADGSAIVRITVDGGAPGAILVWTDLGRFESDETELTRFSTPFTVTLRPCDYRLDASCAGTATVRIQDSDVNRRNVVVQFLPVEICWDGRDNDGDGSSFIDCADDECRPLQTSTTSRPGQGCGDATKAANGYQCDAGGYCVCSRGEQGAEVTCGDGEDNDCDGDVDCFDDDCLGDVCDPGPPTRVCVDASGPVCL